jgi:hypothetical protein
MPEPAAAAASTIDMSLQSPFGMQYYDLKKHWTKKIVPHLDNKKLNAILVRDLNIYTTSLNKKPFAHGEYPCERDFCDWRCNRVGRRPRYWQYVLYAACHWLVNFNLKLAMLVEPTRPWRIVTSDKHSTVWDGADTLFEFNFLAFGIPPQECFDLAFQNGRVLAPGKLRCTNPVAEPWAKAGVPRSASFSSYGPAPVSAPAAVGVAPSLWQKVKSFFSE